MPKKQWQTRRRTRKHGGAFVRKGSYGCAFAKPPLKCKGESARRPANQLSKLLEYKKAHEEFQESVPFRRIDPEKRYFLWAHHMCPLDTTDVLPENRINKCIQKNMGQAAPTVNVRKDPSLIFYDFGGKDISDIVITSGQYGPFFMSFGNLLEGLAVMHANRIAHMDIKPLNIVSMELPTGEFSTRFIDFGLAVSTAKGTSTNPRILGLSPQNYPWWPFDFRFLSRTTPAMTSNELRIWYDNVRDLQGYYPQSSYWREDWTPKYNSVFVQEIMNQVPWEYREHILQEVDVYALGVSLTEVYASKTRHFMRTYGGKDIIVVQLASNRVIPVESLKASDIGGDTALVVWHKTLAQQVSMPFYLLIKQMVAIDPMKRMRADQASAYFNANLIDPILDFFTRMDRFTSRALKVVGIRVENTPIRLHVSPLPTAPPAPTAAPPAFTAPTAPPLPISAPPSTNIQEVLRQAQEALGISAPTSVAKTASTAASDPTTVAIAPTTQLTGRTFKGLAQPPAQPVYQPQPQPLRQAIGGPQRTGLDLFRQMGPPPVPQPQAKPIRPLGLPSNALKKPVMTRKKMFWEQ